MAFNRAPQIRSKHKLALSQIFNKADSDNFHLLKNVIKRLMHHKDESPKPGKKLELEIGKMHAPIWLRKTRSSRLFLELNFSAFLARCFSLG